MGGKSSEKTNVMKEDYDAILERGLSKFLFIFLALLGLLGLTAISLLNESLLSE